MAAKKYYYCADGFNVIGPFNRTEVRKLLTAKVIFPETVISSGGADDWKAARFFPELMSAMSHLEERAAPSPLREKGYFESSRNWQSDPPTDRQIARLKFLRAKLPVNITKGVASEMLDQLITPENQIAWDRYKVTTIDRVHNRFLAFCFSLIPGAGHYYSGHQIISLFWLFAVVAG